MVILIYYYLHTDEQNKHTYNNQVLSGCTVAVVSSSFGFLRDRMSSSVCSIERRSLLLALGTVCVCVCVCMDQSSLTDKCTILQGTAIALNDTQIRTTQQTYFGVHHKLLLLYFFKLHNSKTLLPTCNHIQMLASFLDLTLLLIGSGNEAIVEPSANKTSARTV